MYYADPFLVAAQQIQQAQQAAANSIQSAQVDPNYRLQVSETVLYPLFSYRSITSAKLLFHLVHGKLNLIQMH